MITKGARFFLGFAALAYVAAIVYGLSTNGHVFGVLSLGYKGGVGEHLGYTMLLAVAVVSAGLGFVCLALRDADPEAEAQVAHVAHVPPADSVNRTNFWPIVAAFALGTMAVGLVEGSQLFVGGCIALGIVIIEWAMRNWADRRTGDPEVNREIRNRIMLPIEIPVGAVLCIGVLVAMISRVLLATPRDGSTGVAIVVALLVLATATLIATKPRLSANLISGLLLLGGIAVIASGIVSASVGPREFEHHETDHTYEPPPVGGELPPPRPETTTTTAGATTATTEATGVTTTTAEAGDPTTSTTSAGASSPTSVVASTTTTGAGN